MNSSIIIHANINIILLLSLEQIVFLCGVKKKHNDGSNYLLTKTIGVFILAQHMMFKLHFNFDTF